VTRKEAVDTLHRIRAEIGAALTRPSRQEGLTYVSVERLQRWQQELSEALRAMGE
jgi:hypothetical protein